MKSDSTNIFSTNSIDLFPPWPAAGRGWWDRGCERAGEDGWTLNQKGLQGTGRSLCIQHPAVDSMIAQVLSAKLKSTPSNTSTYKENSEYLPHVPPLEGALASRKRFLILTQTRFFMDLPSPSLTGTEKSPKPAEKSGFPGTPP